MVIMVSKKCNVVLYDNGKTTLGKEPSIPPDFSEDILTAVEIAAGDLWFELYSLITQTSLLLHATAIGKNAIVNGTIARLV